MEAGISAPGSDNILQPDIPPGPWVACAGAGL